jgi:hypothetical protein
MIQIPQHNIPLLMHTRKILDNYFNPDKMDNINSQPTFTLSHNLEIDWQKYLLKIGGGEYKLPGR